MWRHTSATLHPATHQLLHTDSSDLVNGHQVCDLFQQASCYSSYLLRKSGESSTILHHLVSSENDVT